MIRSVLLCAILVVAVGGNAEEIHKCVGENGITYQGLPCAGHETPATDAAQATRSMDMNEAPECGARPLSPARLPWRQATICIGMSDDEVLNLPGWGRPAKIVRMREPRRWREDWIYDTGPAGSRLLHFVNGKLAALESEPAATQNSVATLVSN
jgi:hypothetical protein